MVLVGATTTADWQRNNLKVTSALQKSLGRFVRLFGALLGRDTRTMLTWGCRVVQFNMAVCGSASGQQKSAAEKFLTKVSRSSHALGSVLAYGQKMDLSDL